MYCAKYTAIHPWFADVQWMSRSLSNVFKKQAIHLPTSASLIKHHIYPSTINNPNSPWAARFSLLPLTYQCQAGGRLGGRGRVRRKSTLGTLPRVETVNQGWEKSGLATIVTTRTHASLSHETALKGWRVVRWCVCFGEKTKRKRGSRERERYL